MVAKYAISVSVLSAMLIAASLAGASEMLQPFPLSKVRLLPGPCLDARERNAAYLESLDADRLLYAFRVNAGLDAPGEPLGGWEAPGCEVRGHFVGHYLSACAMLWAATGDEKHKQKAEYMAAEMARCQEALGGEYLSAFPESFWDRLESKTSLPWAPYYTMHKIMTGLCDVYELCGDAQALNVLKGMAGYFKKRTDRFSPEDFGKILDVTEEGGICDVLWRLYGISGEPDHKALAEKFEKRSFLDGLAGGEDNLTGRHGNTHIPLVIGAMRRFEHTGEKRYLDLAAYFWDRVVTARCFATGGTTNGEIWGEPFKLAHTLSNSNHETCKTYNMLKLTRELFCWTCDARYADYYERAFFNGILGTQEPASGMLEYYVPQAAGYKRVFGKPYDSFWCCYGTGIESFAKAGDSIYFHDSETLYVNLFIASELRWKEKGAVITQTTRFPESPETLFEVHVEKPIQFRLNLRLPSWVNQTPAVEVNGQAVTVAARPGMYWTIDREWRSGDQVRLALPMGLHIQPMPDAPNLMAFMYGPIVLAGILEGAGEEPILSSNPLEARPEAELAPKVFFLSDSLDDLSFLRQDASNPLHFVAENQPFPLEFRPFYQIAGESYGLYWWMVPEGSDRHLQLEAENEALAFLRGARHGDLVELRASYARLDGDPRLMRYKDRLAFAMAAALHSAGKKEEAASLIEPFTKPFILRDRAVQVFEITGVPPFNDAHPLLVANDAWDGSHKMAEREGSAAVSTELAARKGHIYFSLPSGSPLRGSGQDARIRVVYYAEGGPGRRFCIEYDGADGPYTATEAVEVPVEKGWRTTELLCPKALFSGRQNLSSDFRINCMGSGDVCIADITVAMSPEVLERIFLPLDEAIEGELDRVEPGDESSERSHSLQAERSAIGMHMGRGWRHAEGSWSWQLKVLPDKANQVVCVYWGSDSGREFDVLVDDTVIATQVLEQPAPGAFLRVTYPVPEERTLGREHVRVTFKNKHGFAGGVFLCATAAP